jgi:ribulose-phosphate 3-epimerase
MLAADWFPLILWTVFCNISYGMPVLAAINKHAKKTIDVHLMIVDPDVILKHLQHWSKHAKRAL